MTDSATNPTSNKGKYRRFVATVGAWLQALDYTSFDYTTDRIDRLEQKVAELTEELRRATRATRVTPQPNDETLTSQS